MTVGEFMAMASPELAIAVKDENENLACFWDSERRNSTNARALANIEITGFEPGENPDTVYLLVGGAKDGKTVQ